MRDFWKVQEQRLALKLAEDKGRVADSIEVRKALMQKVHSGERTLASVQKELAKIKRNAKKDGKITRNQAFNGR